MLNRITKYSSRLFSKKAAYPAPLFAGEAVHGFILRNDPTFRLFFGEDGDSQYTSPWHDVALYPNPEQKNIVNFVNEIPKDSTAKMEIATDEPFNPIKQDIKKGNLRHYPFQSLVNYGALPQTWENPFHTDEATGYKGDNDPIDVCELGNVRASGEIYPVKVLGILGMIDEGELDWKVIAIDAEDERAASLESIADVETVFPGKIQQLVDWFKYYKVPDGKPVNEFAFDEKALEADKAVEIIQETNGFWKVKADLEKAGLWTA
eukprot:snap_masked-scaffold_27-processed-gene-2.15-mRNA-1 protein AED:0.05 eAED:0.05 QI:0/-1/0/1/-1/1/1/0/262